MNYALSNNVTPVEPGAWWLEITPPCPQTEDHSLTVLSVTDSKTPAGPEVARLDAPGNVGAAFPGGASSLAAARNRYNSAASPCPEKATCGSWSGALAPGSWRVACDGREL